MNKIIFMLFFIYPILGFSKTPPPPASTSCATNKLNLMTLFLNNENYYKYLYALSMSRVGVDGELIRRSTEVESKEVLDPGSPALKKMLEQKLIILENILINSGCTKKEAIKFKYQLIKDLKAAFNKKNEEKK